MNLLLAGAEVHGIDLGDREDLSPADVAVRFWLLNPGLLERMHHSQEMSRLKAFRYFSTNANPVPRFAAPTPDQIAGLEQRLNGFYVARKRGKGTRVFTYRDQREWLFLVRHGKACRREGALAEDGEPTSVCYRPQDHKVVKYDAVRGEMGLSSCSKQEEMALLHSFGSSLFGRHDFFPGMGKYSLAPLLHGRGCLACTDIPGMERVSLVGVEFFVREDPWKLTIHKSRDIFDLIESGELTWPRNLGAITKATFQIRFRGAKRPRVLTIVPCNKALYSRNCDTPILESWMGARRFIIDPLDPTSATVRAFPVVRELGLGVAA